MSCGRIALQRSGIEVEAYYASEVDPHAIQVTRQNWPDTTQVGSVTDLSFEDGILYTAGDAIPVGDVDLLIGGSPCQNFSFAGSRKGMATKDNVEILTLEHYLELKNQDFAFHGQSFLFWEYVRLLREINPKYFLLENVVMAEKWKNIISETLGVQPILINSALVSAQNRKRLYWTNIPGVDQPEDRGIVLMDIIEDGWADRDKSLTLTTSTGDTTFKRYIDKSMGQMVATSPVPVRAGTAVDLNGHDILKRVYSTQGKSPTLTAGGGGNTEPKIRLGDPRPASIVGRRINEKGIREDYNKDVPLTQCLQVKPHDEMGCLTTVEKDTLVSYNDPGRYVGAYDREDLTWRKLTPVECERLQTVPDNYTAGVSKTQRYRMLGNGWTVDVIAHIFENLHAEDLI